MDDLMTLKYENRLETASYNSPAISSQEESVSKSVSDDHFSSVSGCPIFCMNDSNGRMHFSLSVYSESTLNPSEQRDLGRLLHEYVGNHYDQYQRTHDQDHSQESFHAGFQSVSPLLQQSLYYDFTAHYPDLDVGHETYFKALNYLFLVRRQALISKSQAQVSQSCSIDDQMSQVSFSPLSSQEPGFSINQSASNRNTQWRDQSDSSERSCQNQNYDEREALFFNRLNICRRKINSMNPDHEHRPSAGKQSFSFDSLSSLFHRRVQSMQNFHHHHPLSSKCSCSAKKCMSIFTEQERQQICKRFWCGRNSRGNVRWIGASVQRHFLPYQHIKPHSCCRRKRRFLIGKYFLHKPAHGKQAVCQGFFLTTLGLHFYFPLYDLLRQTALAYNVKSSRRLSASNSHKVKSKKKSILKHCMKKHVRKYFLQRCLHKNRPISAIIPQIKRSFRRFTIQFPHLLDNRSFKKYLAVVCKALNSKRYHLNNQTTSPSSAPNSHLSKGRQGGRERKQSNEELDPAISSAYGSDGHIMKIKQEDLYELLADDMGKKVKVAANGKHKSGLSICEEKRQSTSSASMHSDPPTMPVKLRKGRHKHSQISPGGASNLPEPQLCSETVTDKKCTKRSYTKRKEKNNQKKKKVSGKFPVKKGRPPLASHPKKIYKIAVNELEDDESKHPMLPACNCTKSKCVSKVSEEQRHVIHAEFWGLDNIARRTWMVKHVHILKPKSRSNRATARLHKMHRKFYLPDSSGTLHDVCKKFFLGTLGFKGVGVLRPQRIPGVNSSSPQVETRKRVLSYQVCQQDVIRVIQYCKSFNKEKNVSVNVDERFTRAANHDVSSSSSRYKKICVPYGFTWKELYKDYCLKHSSVDFGYQTFRSILSLVEHNNFSKDLLDKFQNLPTSHSIEICPQEEQDTGIEQSDTSYQEQYQILQSFPKSQKTHPKPPVTKEPSSSSKTKPETEKKAPKPHKKLKLSKSFLSHDFSQTMKRYKERNAGNKRYNFRRGVPLVSYAVDNDANDQVDDDSLSNDWEDSGYDGIKEETFSDQEKSKRSVKRIGKTVGKKRGRKPGRKKKKKHKNVVTTSDIEPDWTPEEKEPSPKPKPTLLDKKKKIVQRGRKKKTWNHKIDMKQKESTMRFKNRHPILPPCKCNYRKCHEKIPEAQRETIHSLYWGISNKQDRCKWVLEHIQRCSPKTRSNTGLPSRKRETRRYFFPNEQDETIEVCRVFFLRTLGYQWDSVVDTVSRTLPRPGGHLAKSLGCFEEQLPYEVIVRIKTLLKRKKIRKSSDIAAQFPNKSLGDDSKNEDEENFTLEGYTIKDLHTEFGQLHPSHVVDFDAFKQIVRFVLVPGSEAQSEWDIKQEQLQNAAEGSKSGSENVMHLDGTSNSGDGNGPESVIYFTPEFEKLDVEKALTRKAQRRRPVSARNCKEQHPMREPCQCIRKCREKIDQRRREEIHQQYWDLITYNQRKQWILEHIKREAPKRRTNLTGPIKKMETRKFYLEDWSGKKVEICKGFFLSTLGFKWDKMVDTICKTTPRDGQYVRPDQRGKKPPSHKLSETLVTSVTNYVESILDTASCIYPKTPSRSSSGKQKKAPERMPYGLTMKNLFEDYKIKHPNHKVGYESFRKIYRNVIQSEKFQPISASSPPQVEDEDDEPAMEQLSRPPQHLPPAPMLAANMNSSSSERTNEQSVPNFEAAPQSCMYNKNQAAMRIANPEQPHITSYQRQCEPSVMKSFPEGINSFPKSHDVQFYPPGLEQSEEMSMQMFKSICMPASNPNQTYSFYPNSLPLDTFHMNSGPQSLHSGLPYSESLRHSDLMHHHAYQPPAHHHFGQGRFHGFVLPGSSTKEAEQAHHHLHSEMNINPNYRNEFDCNPYPTKTPLLYPPAYPANADNMPSSSSQRHAFNNLPMQAHGMHEIRLRDSTTVAAAAAVVSAPTNQLVNDSSLSNSCHMTNSIPNTHNHQLPTGNEWGSQIVPSPNKEPHNEAEVEKKSVKKPKGRPSKRPPKEKVPKVKKEKKVRPKSNRNSREYNPMLPPCGCSVKKCLEKIPEPRREFIYNVFWDLGCYNKRKQWIAEHIVREDPKRRTSLDNPLRRMETRRFFLPNEEGEKMEVCKGFFLRTLGFKWDKMVDTICKTTEKGQTVVRPDMRGKKGPSRKLNEEVASSVESYVRSILLAAKPAYEAVADQSDEGLEQNHDKDIFVPYGLTMKNFHEDYKGKHTNHKVGYESFCKIFRRVSKEVLDSVSLQEDEKGNLMPTSTKGNTHVINPITGLPQEEPE